MKYCVQLNTARGRLGCITDIERLPDFKMETPNVFMYTKGGSIPHVTFDVLQFITKENLLMQYPLFNTYHMADAIERFKNGVHAFVGYPEYLSYCTFRDYLKHIPEGSNIKLSMPLWGPSGKRLIDTNRYMDLMESFQPDIYVALADGGTNKDSSNKRISKAVQHSEELFKQCLEKHRESDVLKGKAIIGAIQGGYNTEARIKSAKFFSNTCVDGFLVDGLFTNPNNVDDVDCELVENILTTTLSNLPNEKLRIIHGPWNPLLVFKMIQLGIDVFDTSLACAATERGCALNFPFDFNALKEIYGPVNSIESSEPGKNCISLPVHYYEISLHDKKYFDDLRPLVDECSCLSCSKYTRSYIHHLLCTKELQASILLMIHNTHYLIEFFKKVRNRLKDENELLLVSN